MGCQPLHRLAADVRVVVEGGVVHRVLQPVEAPAGWTMFERVGLAAAAMPMARMSLGGLRSAEPFASRVAGRPLGKADARLGAVTGRVAAAPAAGAGSYGHPPLGGVDLAPYRRRAAQLASLLESDRPLPRAAGPTTRGDVGAQALDPGGLGATWGDCRAGQGGVDALVADLESVDAVEEEVAPLRDLAARLVLEPAGGKPPLAELQAPRERTLAVLRAFAAAAASGDPAPEPAQGAGQDRPGAGPGSRPGPRCRVRSGGAAVRGYLGATLVKSTMDEEVRRRRRWRTRSGSSTTRRVRRRLVVRLRDGVPAPDRCVVLVAVAWHVFPGGRPDASCRSWSRWGGARGPSAARRPPGGVAAVAGRAGRLPGAEPFAGGRPAAAIAFAEGLLVEHRQAWLRPAGLVTLLLGPLAALLAGPVAMLEAIDLLGIALFLVVLPPGRDRYGAVSPSPETAALAIFSLRVCAGLALVVLAFSEKFANPALAWSSSATTPPSTCSTCSASPERRRLHPDGRGHRAAVGLLRSPAASLRWRSSSPSSPSTPPCSSWVETS